MPDWARFHAATVAGTRPTRMADTCALMWSWLDLSAEERSARLTDLLRTQPASPLMLEAPRLIGRRLLREIGLDVSDTPALTAFFERVGTGQATDVERQAKWRIDAATEVLLALTPLVQASSNEGNDLETLNLSTQALSVAIEGIAPGLAKADALSALRQAIDTFAGVGAGFSPPVAKQRAWWMGLAWWTMATGLLSLGRHAAAREAFERSAGFYDTAGEPDSAASCRRRVADLATAVAADFDTAAERDVLDVLEPQSPLDRVESLVRVLTEIGRTGDRFGAAGTGEEAAAILRAAGFPDPETAFDAAVDRWVETAAGTYADNALLAHLCRIAGYWSAILGARISARLERDPAGSQRAERTLRAIGPFAVELARQAAQARRASVQRLAVWDPAAAALMAADDDTPVDTRTVDALTTISDALYRLRIACNEGASDTQVADAIALRAQAEALGSRISVAQALNEQAYVLLALKRASEVPELADLAIRTLLGDHAPALGAFATGFERELYLTAIGYKAQALAAQSDHDGIIALCEPVVRDIESERMRVSSPYQQSAFLATRAQLYELLAAAAYRTGRTDLLVAVTELLKSRAALRSRLTRDARANDDTLDTLEEELREIRSALATALPGSGDAQRLRERRRWLSTARAIARARHAASVPEMSVAAVQAALSASEAAISWFWIGTGTVIVLAVSADDVRLVHVTLDETGQAQLRDYLACVTTLSGDTPRYAALMPQIEALVPALGESLLPSAIREFIASKSRLVLSPHRGLHLFPFHAIRWRAVEGDGIEQFLIERFAIRHVPNLSSLLLPWGGRRDGAVLALGVAQFDDVDIPPLPHAEQEAAAVAAAHGTNGRVITGVTRAQFDALALDDIRCLHLATHGSSVLAGENIDDPMAACVHLRDGALSGWDIEALALRAELVVLAACHSGQRSIAGRGLRSLPGDDLFGLQAVLFEAGVGMVLGALWPVHDATAFAILIDFHRAYAAGAAPDDALRAAIVAHLADGTRQQGLFFWAPLTLSALGRTA